MLTSKQQEQLSVMFDFLEKSEHVADLLPDEDAFKKSNDKMDLVRYFIHYNTGEPTGFSRISHDKVDFTENVYPEFGTNS